MRTRTLIAALFFLSMLVTSFVSAQTFSEEFSYTAGDTLNGSGGWVVQSTPSYVNPIKVASPGLTYTDYPAIAGNAALVDTTGQDLFRPFSGITSGTVYASFLVNVTKATTNGDYFFHFTKAFTFTFLGRVYVKSSGSNIAFGLLKGSTGTVAYTPADYSLNTTYLLVLKYQFNGGSTTDDSVYLYINPAISTTEPTPNLSFGSTNADFDTLSAVNLRQGSGSNAPRLLVDGIRVDTSWAGALGVGPMPQVYSVGTGHVPDELGNFPTLKAAFDSLNNGFVFTDNTLFYITSDITEPNTGGIGLGLAVDPSPYTITFKPYTGVSPTITLQYPSDGNSGPSGALVVGLTGASNIAWASNRPTRNIVFDGSNTPGGMTRDLTIQSTGATRNAFPFVITADVQNVVVMNCNIYYKATAAATTSGNLFVGAMMIRSATATNTGTTEKIPSNLTIMNNHISSNFPGVVQNSQGLGSYSAGAITEYPTGIAVIGNTIEGKRRGIALYYMSDCVVEGNEIVLTQNVADGLTNEAIYTLNIKAASTISIYNNRITSVASINSSANTTGNSGISIEGEGVYNIFNNMISGFALNSANANKSAYVYGIKVANANAAANIYFNSMYMNDLASVGTGSVNYRGLYLVNGTVEAKNNVIANYEDDFASYNVYRPNNGTAGVFNGSLVSNYNNLFRSGASNASVGFYDASGTAGLADWQSATMQDSNSVTGAPQFESDSNLHISTTAYPVSATSNAGTPVPGILTDIDGDLRDASNPDIGADEFIANPIIPVVGFSASPTSLNFGSLPVGSTKTDSVTVTNVGAIDSLVIDSVRTTNSYFSASPSNATIDTNGSMKFYVTFAPTSGGTFNAAVIFYHSGSTSPDSVTVSGSAVGFVTIAEARKDANGDLVPDHLATGDTLLIYGVITSPNMQASGTSYYVQDSTAGINIFSFSPQPEGFVPGDSVFVIGKIGQFRGLTELLPLSNTPTHFGKISSGAQIPEPKRLTVQEYLTNAEMYEGQLIRIDTLYKSSGTWAANSSVYAKNDPVATDSVQIFIDTDTGLQNWPEPTYPISVIGLAVQYSSGSAVRDDGYEISPRDTNDIIPVVISGVADGSAGLPIKYDLMNNYPNPFNPATNIKFALPKGSRITLKIYDLLGREVRVLINKEMEAGYHQTIWDGRNGSGVSVPTGLYFYQLIAGDFKATKKMMLLK